ncbi:Flavin containing amine oxidoreductase [Microlunatus sagamiharensis]|uniref:Flavin containing amine oxidoreductase n=1 Tax=Microlunatus sagamiharensis TaxID=546874 RepID=A0A1H2MPR2_9ACTN|nr:FAD-dependent oxidoreductase [Microlunatus sagamiharensis]SDU95219.1 Flavin containing amine oxidoreductase [Microlunatus sagamiharensis]
MPTSTGSLVAVVGGGLAGMAAAARLAKMGHRVRLHEATDRLGGAWAPYALAGPDAGPAPVLVDDAPAVLTFPAPWRDLFRKSGRPLEAELARAGYALAPAPPTVVHHDDGSSLALPSDRGEQQEVLLRAYGPAAAARWQHLLDSLDDVWQALRPLGLEEPWEPGSLNRDLARRLRSRRSLADLADDLGDPHLRALVRATAYRLGTTPEQAPALAAVGLLVERTFGRWQVVAERGRPLDTGRTSVLVETLAARLGLRKVEVRLGSRVEGVETADRAVTGVRTSDAGTEPADAVVLAVDPWTAASLAPAPTARSLRRSLRRASPARLPRAEHVLLEEGGSGDSPAPGQPVAEHLHLDADGRPLVVTLRRLGDRLVRTTVDHRADHLEDRPGAGLVTDGFRGWRRRPGTATPTPGLALAGAASPSGPSPWAVAQSGALAAYAVAGRRD